MSHKHVLSGNREHFRFKQANLPFQCVTSVVILSFAFEIVVLISVDTSHLMQIYLIQFGHVAE